MVMYDDILLTTDGSEESEIAIEHAKSLAEKYDAEVHVLYVSDVRAQMGDPTMEFVVENLEEAGNEAVDSVQDEIGNIDSTAEVRTGVPHREIINYAEEEGIDLICMSTHGRSGLDRVLIGSVTEKVIRKSSVPVLTVPIRE